MHMTFETPDSCTCEYGTYPVTWNHLLDYVPLIILFVIHGVSTISNIYDTFRIILRHTATGHERDMC